MLYGNFLFCESARHRGPERFNLLRKTLLFFLRFSQVMHLRLDTAIKTNVKMMEFVSFCRQLQMYMLFIPY